MHAHITSSLVLVMVCVPLKAESAAQKRNQRFIHEFHVHFCLRSIVCAVHFFTEENPEFNNFFFTHDKFS